MKFWVETEKIRGRQFATMSDLLQCNDDYMASTEKGDSPDSSERKVNREVKKEPEEEPLESINVRRTLKMPLVDDDFAPLSGLAFCHLVLKKYHFTPLYQMIFPTSLHQYLPTRYAPVTVTCRGKTWDMMFFGDSLNKRLDGASWRMFVEENDLKIGDALFWEVLEYNKNKANLKVQVIKGDWPLGLEEKESGCTPIDPITIH